MRCCLLAFYLLLPCFLPRIRVDAIKGLAGGNDAYAMMRALEALAPGSLIRQHVAQYAAQATQLLGPSYLQASEGRCRLHGAR